MHTLDLLQSYRLGSRQATVELQRQDAPAIHIPFDILKLVEDVKEQHVRAIILTGTAGDGKTYLAYRIVDALGLSRNDVQQAQAGGGYRHEGVFIDLDLSAGSLTEHRVRDLYEAFHRPERLTLICANEGKLSELEKRLAKLGLSLPGSTLRVNLSRRALVSRQSWEKVLSGVLNGPIWQNLAAGDAPLVRNRAFLQDQAVAERLRRYLLLPYLLGEPITVRELLSLLSYALGGGMRAAEARAMAPEPDDRLPYLLFNTIFSQPGAYSHGGRATPNEKLLWWLFRFDPAIQASPEADLRLLVEFEELEATPPPELRQLWARDLVVKSSETSDAHYRQRLSRFMAYARRWYALFSNEGFTAYFPFHHLDGYLQALNLPTANLDENVQELIRGLNLLLSGGREDNVFGLRQYYLAAKEVQHVGAIYGNQQEDFDQFRLVSDAALESDNESAADRYLERLPRRLVLQHKHEEDIRLPVSLMLYEVLMSAANPRSGFPATLWAKERGAVARFVSQLSRRRHSSNQKTFVINLDNNRKLTVQHHTKFKQLQIS